MNRVGKIITISALTLVLFIIGVKLGKTEQRMNRVLVNYESRMNALEDSIEGMKKVFNAAMGSVDAHFYLEDKISICIMKRIPHDSSNYNNGKWHWSLVKHKEDVIAWMPLPKLSN